jgi:lysophospholipase L1-like esterase
VQIGGNDIIQQRLLSDIENDIKNVFTILSSHSDRVLVMTSGNVGTARSYMKNGKPNAALEAQTRAVRELFMRISKEHSVTYVDLFEEPEHDLFFLEPNTYLALDGLHPSEKGYGLWYTKLRPFLFPTST